MRLSFSGPAHEAARGLYLNEYRLMKLRGGKNAPVIHYLLYLF